MSEGRLDEVLLRFHDSGPEFDGWLSNHGPMAGDALLRVDPGADVEAWAATYGRRLEEAPAPRWRIDTADWPEALGDPRRIGDWIAFFDERLRELPWREVLAEYWPTLVTGSLASATHGLIRTGHAVRALAEHETGPRVDELAHALGYWAARWQPFPNSGLLDGRGRPHDPPVDAGPAEEAASLAEWDARSWPRGLAALGVRRPDGGIRTRLRALDGSPAWRHASRAWLGQPQVEDPHAALLALVDAGVSHYARHGSANPIMLVHAATAPRAADLVLPHLPEAMHGPTVRWVGLAAGALVATYGTADPGTAPTSHDEGEQPAPDRPAMAARVRRHGDEHAVKLVEVALESAGRGNRDAGSACEQALSGITPLPGWQGA